MNLLNILPKKCSNKLGTRLRIIAFVKGHDLVRQKLQKIPSKIWNVKYMQVIIFTMMNMNKSDLNRPNIIFYCQCNDETLDENLIRRELL